MVGCDRLAKTDHVNVCDCRAAADQEVYNSENRYGHRTRNKGDEDVRHAGHDHRGQNRRSRAKLICGPARRERTRQCSHTSGSDNQPYQTGSDRQIAGCIQDEDRFNDRPEQIEGCRLPGNGAQVRIAKGDAQPIGDLAAQTLRVWANLRDRFFTSDR
jgi:hypothetical protein